MDEVVIIKLIRSTFHLDYEYFMPLCNHQPILYIPALAKSWGHQSRDVTSQLDHLVSTPHIYAGGWKLMYTFPFSKSEENPHILWINMSLETELPLAIATATWGRSKSTEEVIISIVKTNDHYIILNWAEQKHLVYNL